MTTKLSGVASALFTALPTRYRSTFGLITSALAVVASILAVVVVDHPEVAIVLQVLTALGFVERPSSAPEDSDAQE